MILWRVYSVLHTARVINKNNGSMWNLDSARSADPRLHTLIS